MRLGIFFVFMLVSISTVAGTWKDDFNDGDLEGWSMTKAIWQGPLMPGEGSWSIKDGVVIGGDGVGSTLHSLWVSEGMPWSDYAAEVSIKLPKPLEIQEWAIVGLFIMPEEGKSSGFNVRNIQGSVFTEAFIYMHPATMIHISTRPFKIEDNRWYRLKLKVVERIDHENGIIQCFIDDEMMFQFQGYRKGAPGFYTYQCAAMFDDFVVTGLGIPDGGPGLKAVTPHIKLATTWANIKKQ